MKRKTGSTFTKLMLVVILGLLGFFAACTSEPSIDQPTEPVTPTPPIPVDESLAVWRLNVAEPTLAALVGREASFELSLSNIGLDVGPYRLETDVDWLTLSPASGRLEPGASETVVLSALCQEVGTRKATLTVLGGKAALKSEVTLDCAEQPAAKLELSREVLSLEAYLGRTVSGQVTLSNSGTAPLDFQFEVSTQAAWLSLATTSATLPPAESQAVSFELTCPASPGTYSTDLILISNDPVEIERVITVTLSCTLPSEIDLLTDSIGLNLVEGVPETATLTLANRGQGELTFSAETAAGWLGVTPLEGAVGPDDTLDLSLELSCPPVAVADEIDSYQSDLIVRSNDPNKPTVIVPVRLTCRSPDAPELLILELTLELNGTTGQQSFGRIAFKNVGGSPLEFSVSANQPWVDDIDQTNRRLAAGAERTDLVGASCGAEARVRNATLTIRSNDLARPEQTIALRLVCGSPPERTLELRLSGLGRGQVESVPTGIVCGDDCAASFPRGTEVLLRAQPLGGSSFTGWASGPCVGKQGDCQFILDDNLSVDASFSEAPAEGYSIVLRFSDSNLSPSQRAIFERAAARWSEVITTDLPDFNVDLADNACWQGVPAFTGTADDLIIDVTAPTIDGAGDRLGSAGPCKTRPADGGGGGLPYFGAMQLDKDDLDRLELRGTLEDVILHEMGHVLGIGTLWQAFDLMNFSGSTCQGSSGIEYTGEAGIDAYAGYGAGGFPPIEDSGPAGTKCAHWHNRRFDNELMTGYVNDEGNALSRLSIATLEDMGYSVNYDAADPYELPVLRRQSGGKPLREILITPQPE